MGKRIISCCMSFIMCLLLVFTIIPTSTAFAAGAGFHVSGTKLYDGNGNEFVMRGVNYPHAWYTSEYRTAIPAIAKQGFNSVRIVVADGDKWSKTSYSELSDLISVCKENNLVAIFDVHDTTGSDDTWVLDNAVNYWIEMKDLLNANTDYVIVNIANEWYGTWDDGSSWKNGYVSAIKKLRNAGINNTLMVDCAGWGQYPQVIFDYGQEVLSADSHSNTMFSIHMYEYAGGNSSTVKNNIDNVLNKNLCLTIGEFGGYHTNGDVDEDTILSYGQQKSVGWLAWSWYGNSGDLDFLDVTYDWAGNGLTDFGNRVINGSNGVKQTASTCSIFTGSSSNTGNTGNTENSGNTSNSDNTGNTGSTSSNIVNLFYGSSYADNWAQAVTVSTAKNGGALNMTSMTSGDFIWVEYTGAYNELDLVLQSWSGGNQWAKISPSEAGSTGNGTYYAKFYYNDIVNVYGSDFSTVDRMHVSAHSSGITVISVDFN